MYNRRDAIVGGRRVPITRVPISPERFQSGLTFQEFVRQADLNRERLERVYREIELPDEVVQAFQSLPEPLKAVVISEDWAADAVVSLPLLVRLAEASRGKLEVRIFPRDKNMDLMNLYLKEGKYQSIPVFVFFDDGLQRQVGFCQERPASLNAMHKEVVDRFVQLHPHLKEAMALPPADRPEDVKRVYRGWVSEQFAQRRQEIEVEVIKELRQVLGV